jgi:hypothetical protein
LHGRQNKTVVQVLCVANATTSETFRFKSSKMMSGHGWSSEKGINSAYGHMEYKDLQTVVIESLAGFACLRRL